MTAPVLTRPARGARGRLTLLAATATLALTGLALAVPASPALADTTPTTIANIPICDSAGWCA